MKLALVACSIGLVTACAAPDALESGLGADGQVGTTVRGVGTYAEVTGFGNNPGGLRGYVYVPDNMPPNAPLVLALHACSQNATTYRNAGWDAVADRLKFYVLYPEQQSRNNGLNCFNWAGEFGDPTNLTRGEGENQSIIQMIDKLKADHSIDASRVFIMGHSGGGAQTALMIATWPEVFAGAGIIAGVPYNCTTTFTQVSTCLTPGINRTPQEWGDRVRAGHPGYSGPRPRVAIWHGTNDTTVSTTNMTELLEQWTNAHGIDMTADATDMVDGANRRRYQDAGGVTRVEVVEIPNMGHGTPVDPQASCGTAGAFFLDANICAAQRLAEFFGLAGGVGPTPDTTPPTVSFTAPRAGAMVSGSVPVRVTAMDDVAVTRVEISVNGTLRQTINAAPYDWSWSTAGLANGQYTLRAVAFDAAGNRGMTEVQVTLTGGMNDLRPPTVDLTSPANGATVSGTVQLAATAMDDFTVAKVEFLVDGVKIGESTTAPYAIAWDSASVAPGMHRVSARALDGAGNSGLDEDTTVNVERLVIGEGFAETFSGANRSPDRPGWSLGAWQTDAADHTGMATSGSIIADIDTDRNSVEAVATVPVRVGATDTQLALWRRASLRPAGSGASAAFRVVAISGGMETVVHETSATTTALTDADWTEVVADLSAFAGRDITLAFELSATDPSSSLTDARAWIDDIRLRTPSGSSGGDTTPPTVSFTSPAPGSTVRGLITVKIEASDDTAVTQVLLFLGSDLIGSDYRAPYEVLWDTAVFPEGAQTLTVRAFDAAGNLANADLAITVARGSDPGAEPDPNGTAVPAGRKYWGCTTSGAPIDSAATLFALLALAGWVRMRGSRRTTRPA